jgi:hypothetical protein
MKINLMYFLIFCCLSWSQQSNADVFYSNNFENTSNLLTEWSNHSTDQTPGTVSHSADRFLGQFGNTTTSLSLTNLPLHNQITLSFDLYIIRTWDGSTVKPSWPSSPIGPDIWFSSVQGAGQLIYTTFTNHEQYGFRQSYPLDYPSGDFPARSGAIEINTLGFLGDPPDTIQDSVYHLNFTFTHSQSDLVINFGATGLENLANESWGIDNVTVTPEPATLLLFGLGGAIAARRKK